MQCHSARNAVRVWLVLFSIVVAASPLVAGDVSNEALFGEVTLVQEVDCSRDNPDAQLQELPAGISKVENLLGTPCRVLPNNQGDSKYFAYRVGKGKGLKAGACYVLNVEFPDDKPRGFQILNWGCETARGVATGAAIGDALAGLYVNNNPESLAYPQSGKFLQWRELFFLHDRSLEISRPRDPAVRPLTPADGFWVIIAQFPAHNDPLSAGAAVSKIRLYEVKDFAKCALKLNLPPNELPRRHILWREEMADGVIAMGHKPEEKDEKLRGVKNIVDWYEYKAKLMQFLGINTFSKDLLEFGHNQGWDSTDGGGNQWFYQSPTPQLWADVLSMLSKYDVDVLPYYEYCGSVGAKGLGSEGRCRTLAGKQAYTHINWTEKRNVDVADPDFVPDAKKLLDCTIGKFKDKTHFVGAWFRPRPSAIPISFNDNDLKWFGTQANGGQTPTREQLKNDKALLEKYYGWWFTKRREFLVALRDHLRQTLGPKAVLLYTTDTSEAGISLPSELTGAGQKDGWSYKTAVVNDDPANWTKTLSSPNYKMVKSVDFKRVVGEDMFAKAQLRAPGNWGEWEWQHACPPSDPQNYKSTDGVLLTCTFNRLYTVATATPFDNFRGPSGLACVRHYTLNENEMYSGAKKDQILGYFVSDVERGGPYCMLAEARALANGDPSFLGYLMGNSYNRGFPEYARAFHAAFLALPALPSVVAKNATSDAEVVVRTIATPKNGTYVAIVNTGFGEKKDVAVTLPATGKVIDVVTGQPVPAPNGKLVLSLYPGQLRSLRVD
ncbi:MAG TPA: hypothetical protein VGP72_11875 [Planctomycetota bacterium]|jgi:hypothetical protein